MKYTLEEIKKLIKECEQRAENKEKPVLDWVDYEDQYDHTLVDGGWTAAGAIVGYPVDQTTFCSVHYLPYEEYCISTRGTIAAMLLAEALIKRETKKLFE